MDFGHRREWSTTGIGDFTFQYMKSRGRSRASSSNVWRILREGKMHLIYVQLVQTTTSDWHGAMDNPHANVPQKSQQRFSVY
ncbi:hypothetical protein NPIL_276901 [Nephila pilipes]|uniref:Uncharacterized protein n=1 Tax=Nephila pilipes TaxID=299642 RepID=A0A8X6TEQ2_NEPPI|nr:hypothetical protein NPIL_276901 [Nephila pilipes]